VDGAAYFGFVLALIALVGPGVVAVVVAAVLLLVLLDVLEDPQPAAASSAEQAMRAAMPLFIR
jgi:uncharacterized membrane protein